MLEQFTLVDWFTNFFALVEVVTLLSILVFLVRIVKPASEKFNVRLDYRYFYAGVALYFLYKAVYFSIYFYRLPFFESAFFANISLLGAGILILAGTNQALECCRREVRALE